MTFTKYFDYRAGLDHFFVLNCSFFGIFEDVDESNKNTPGDNEADEGEDGNQ
jgi:hypothetical protein